MSKDKDNLSDNPFTGDSDNRDLTISFQQKQIDELNKKLAFTEAQLNIRTDRIRELENIKSKVEASKKKSQIEQIQGKYFGQKKLKLTWELIVEICSHVMDGFSTEQACTNLGIERQDYFNWTERAKLAKTESDIFYTFFTAVERAKNFEEKRYKSKVDEALFSNDYKNFFTEQEIKSMSPEERVKTLSLINRSNLDKGKLALDLLRLRRPKKYFNSVLDFSEETIERITETSSKTTSKTESVAQHEVVSKIQEIIKRKTANISILEESDDTNDDDFSFD
jgi:hypothetical protein